MKALIISLVLVFILLANIAYASYLVYFKFEPYQGYYQYEVHISNHNNSTIEVDIPLPHDEEIYRDLSSPQFTIESSEYGKVLHVETNSSIVLFSKTSFDKKSKINPKLSLTTQKGNSAYIRLKKHSPGNVSIILELDHEWFIGFFPLDFSSKHEYITISKEPYKQEDIPDNEFYDKYESVFTQEGFMLDEGWNLAPLTKGEYIEWD